jgi:hypothetical protein
LVSVEGKERNRWVYLHLDLYTARSCALFLKEGRDMLDDLANIPQLAFELTRAGKEEEVGEGGVEAPGLRLDGLQNTGALFWGEGVLVFEQRGRVDNGRQRIADSSPTAAMRSASPSRARSRSCSVTSATSSRRNIWPSG